ncbi:hypothetical protein D5086_014634 [Populus alba]|uniref:Uncharacterized protein n=1 Tax=Populus alba TaxID=43335 RepID=A0ACC4BY26_POPAL
MSRRIPLGHRQKLQYRAMIASWSRAALSRLAMESHITNLQPCQNPATRSADSATAYNTTCRKNLKSSSAFRQQPNLNIAIIPHIRGEHGRKGQIWSYLGANRDHGVQASKRISRYRSQGYLDEAAIEKIDG